MSINNPSGKKETLVEEGTTFRGSISSDCRIVVKGGLEGEVEGPALHVAETGAVSGKVKVTELHSRGVLEGEFEADVAHLSGQVKDKTVIRAREIDVKLSPAKGKMELVFGECEVEVGEVVDKDAAVQQAEKAAEAERKPQDTQVELRPEDEAGDDKDGKDNKSKGKRRGKSETNSPPPN